MSKQDFIENKEDNPTEIDVTTEDFSNEDDHEIEEGKSSEDFSEENDYDETELEDYNMDIEGEEAEILTQEIEVNMGALFESLNNFQGIVNNL